MIESEVELDTANRLYVFFAYGRPAFFVCVDEGVYAQIPHRLQGLPVYSVRRGIGYEEIHKKLHGHLGTPCRGKRNEKPRRSGRDSWFAELVRRGNGTRERPAGCFDTPFIDIDGLWFRDGPHIIERKNASERMDGFQEKSLEALRSCGFRVEVRRNV